MLLQYIQAEVYDFGFKCATLFNVSADVVAYVDVWSADKTGNYSKPFVQQLLEMGAQVRHYFHFIVFVVFTDCLNKVGSMRF